MRISTWGLSLVVAAMLGSGSLVHADPYRGRSGSWSGIELSGRLYTYVPTVRTRRVRSSWAVTQLRNLMGRNRRSTSITLKLPTYSMPKPAAPGSAAIGADAIDATGAVFEAMASGGQGAGSGEGGESGMGPATPGEGGLTDLNAVAIEAAIASLPVFAKGVAGAMTEFSDGAIDLVAGLSSMLATAGLDWGQIFRDREELQSDRQKEAEKEKQKRAKQKGADELAKERMRRELQRVKVQQVVKSIFKILIGLGLGVAFWLVVRRSF